MAHFQVCYTYYALLFVLLFLCLFVPCMEWIDERVTKRCAVGLTERCTPCVDNVSYCHGFDSTLSHLECLFNVPFCVNCKDFLTVKKTKMKMSSTSTNDGYNENSCREYKLAIKKRKVNISSSSTNYGYNENSYTDYLAVKKRNMKMPAASTSDGYNETSTASCQGDSHLRKGEVKSEAIVSCTLWMYYCLVVLAVLFVSLFIVLLKKLTQYDREVTSKSNKKKIKDIYISYYDPAPSDFLLDEISPLTNTSSRLMGINLKKHKKHGPPSDLDHLFEFRRDSCFRQTCTACPVDSLASHFASGTIGRPGTTVELHKEGVRLATFKDFPTGVKVSAIRLAQAGFYYTLERDVVKCFSCGVTHQGWQLGDRPSLIHARISPNCDLVRGCDTTNLSLPLPVRNHPNFQVAGGNLSSGSRHSDVQMGSHSTSLTSSGPQAPAAPSLAQSAPSTAVRAPAAPATTSAPSSQPSPGTSMPPVSQTLATSTSSISTSSTSTRSTRTSSTSTSSSTVPRSLTSRRLDLAGSVYPLYSQMEARKRSYDNWSQEERQSRPDVDELISLGFFYAGYADCVRCFFCGIGLKSWEPGDVPAEVHARWRPTCEYLRLVKGDEFVDGVAGGAGISSSRETRDTSNASTNTGQAGGSPSTANIPDTPVVNRARESGFNDQQIAEAIGRLRTIGMEGAMDVMLIEVLTNIFGASGGMSASTGRGGDTTQPPSTAERQSQGSSATESSAVAPAENAANVQDDGDEVAEQQTAQAIQVRHQQLLQENARLREARTCQRCHDSPVGVIFLPCGHIIACTTCSPNIRRCLRCDTVIRATANVFFS